MSIEIKNNLDSQEQKINNPKKTEQETQKAVENVKKWIDKAKEARNMWNIETQVWPILERFWVSEKDVNKVVNILSKSWESFKNNFIKKINLFWKSGNKDFIIKEINRLVWNKEDSQNKTEIDKNKIEIDKNKTERKALTKGFLNFWNNKSNFFQKKIWLLIYLVYNSKQERRFLSK